MSPDLAEPVTTPRLDPVALDSFLADLEWSVLRTVRPELRVGRTLGRSQTGAQLIYVLSGSLRLHASTVTLGAGGAADVPRRAGDLDVDRLGTGDFLLITDPKALTLTATETAQVVSSSLVPSARTAAALHPLPAWMSLRCFAQLEPDIAQLAASLGRGCEPAAGHPAVGLGTVCGRIATAIIAVAMRSWAERGCGPQDWLARVQHPQLGRALDAMHADLARSWTVADLAGVAMMSRSAFAERFTEVLGDTPAGYLTRIRMVEARRYLAGNMSVTQASRRLGYESDAGFSRAFSRHVGTTPSAWRRAQTPG